MSNINLFFSFFLIVIFFKDTFQVCDSNCQTCTDDICSNCKASYHFLLGDDTGRCYAKSEIGENYYVNHVSLKFEPCNGRCQTCSDGNTPTDTNNQCITCKTGLYKKIISSDPYLSNCYLPYEVDNDYYKDTSVTPPIFKKCYERCSTCSQAGDALNNNCDSCKAGTNSDTQYYKLDSGETGNCYLNTEIPDGYEIPLVEELNEIATQKINERNGITSPDNGNYSYIYERIARKCYRSCKTCNGFGDDVEMKCLTCLDNYFFYNNNCYKKCPKPDTYQLKDTNYKCRELVDGYKIVTEYRTSTDVVNFLLYHDLGEFDFEKDLIIADKIFGQVYSLKNKKTNDELAESLKLATISISDECLNKIIQYYHLENDDKDNFMLIKFDRNYSDATSNYKSSVNQIDFYLFFPYYEYDIIAGEKVPNGIYEEIKISSICTSEEDIKIIKPLINMNEALTGVNLTQALEIYKKYNSYDMLLSSSAFFSDICSTYKSDSGKDVELAERREKYYQNISFCEGNCIFSGFDYKNYKVFCDCDASLFLTSEQYDDVNYKDRKNLIKNLTYSTINNIFPDNVSSSYMSLNFKTMKCTNLTFDVKIALHNAGNWLAASLFVIKVVIFGIFLAKRFIPMDEEYNKRKQKIEQEMLTYVPNARIMTSNDLTKIKKYHIEKDIWGNYAGAYKSEKGKKTKKIATKKKHKDNGDSNKLTHSRLTSNKNGDSDSDNENEEENKGNKLRKNKFNPPKRLGYIYSDDRAEEELDENSKKNNIFKSAMKDLNYEQKEKNTKIFFEKGINKTNIVNGKFPISKDMLNETEDENEKNTNIQSMKKSKNKKIKKGKMNEIKNTDGMVDEILPIEPNDIVDDERNEAPQKFNENNINEESKENNYNKETEGDNQEKSKNKKNSKKKKKNLGDTDGVPKYKKEYLYAKKLEGNPSKIEPAINFRFCSMTSPEKLSFMKFKIAVNLDKRTFMEIYMGCLKMSQMIFNFIYIPYYHNMKFLKLYFFVFVFNLNLFTTTIFYSHYYMGRMYGFKILMCSLQSIIVSAVLYLFSYSKKKFTSVHVLDIWKMTHYKKVYKIIIIISFIVEFLFSGFIWFFSASFNAVYQNSYIYYLLHVLESNVITLALPFLFCFLPAFLRYLSLTYEKKALYCINNYVDIFF